jgi:hypothetical protein
MMVKKIFVSVLVLIVLGAAATVIYQNTQGVAAQAASEAESVNGYGNGGWGNQASGTANQQANQPVAGVQALQTLPGAVPVHQLPAPGELSEGEKSDLLYMREEEKLARDVYTTLYNMWGIPVFQNIAASEQAHMDAVRTLLDVYGLEDPAQEQAGVFTNPELQSLYEELTARGSQSLSEALKVGGAIEEIDILDLQDSLSRTDNADIQQVYSNLLRGSSSHLGAFARTLQTQTGETYQPQYMELESYNAILNSGSQGGGYGSGGQGAQAGQGAQTGQGTQGGRGGQGGQGYRGGRGAADGTP